MEYEIYPVDELRHWGVKGMRWGVRRYQNRDGTLTPAGKKRYDKELEKLKAEEKMLKNQERTKAKLDKLEELRKSNEARRNNLDKDKNTEEKKPEPPKMEKKAIKDMSDDELRERKARLTLEKEYKQLLAETRGAGLEKGKSFAKTFIGDPSKKILFDTSVDIGAQAFKSFGVKKVNEFLKKKGFEDAHFVYTNNKKKS